MLWRMFVVLSLLWLLGMATAITLNGFIHILLGTAIVLLALLINQDRKSLSPLTKVRNAGSRWRS